jgi:hypothetical protein
MTDAILLTMLIMLHFAFTPEIRTSTNPYTAILYLVGGEGVAFTLHQVS